MIDGLYIILFLLVVVVLVIVLFQQVENLFSRNQARVAKVSEEMKVLGISDPLIISLTTSPERLRPCLTNLHQMIRDKCIPEDAIIEVNLPRTFRRTGGTYPSDLGEIHPQIHIYRDSFEDEGPATKILPTLDRARQRYNHGLVVSIDDDIYYEREVFDLHRYFYHLYEGKVATCFCDLFRTFDFTAYFSSHLTNIHKTLSELMPSFTLRKAPIPHKQTFFVEGFGSVGYPLHLFDPDKVRNYIQQEPICRNSDDLLISMALLESKIPIIKLTLDEVYHPLKLIRILDYGLESDALHNIQSHHEKYSLCVDRFYNKCDSDLI